MTIYDAVMIGAIVAGMIWGAFRGITWQLASIASLVLGYMVSFPLSGPLASHFPGEPVVARGLAMLTLYVASSGGVFFVAWLIRATLRAIKFEAYDRHLGMILGGLEGAFLGIVGTLFVLSLAPQSRTPILSSRSGHVVSATLNAVQPALPGEVREVLAPFWGGNATTPAKAVVEIQRPGKSADVPAIENLPKLKSVAQKETKTATDWLEKNQDQIERSVVKAVEDELPRVSESNGRSRARR